MTEEKDLKQTQDTEQEVTMEVVGFVFAKDNWYEEVKYDEDTGEIKTLNHLMFLANQVYPIYELSDLPNKVVMKNEADVFRMNDEDKDDRLLPQTVYDKEALLNWLQNDDKHFTFIEPDDFVDFIQRMEA